jgi:stage II sporulation protein M
VTGYGRRGRPAGLLGFLFGSQADYVKRLMPLFGLCMGLFVFSMTMGFYMGDRVSMEVLEDMLGAFPDLANMDITVIFLFILLNNVIKSFVWMVLGVIGSAPPLFFAILNGFFLGNFSYTVSLEQGLGFTAAALIPHGIIEIPTILLSSAAGMALGYAVVNSLRGRGSVREEFARVIRLFISRIVPLLLVAALFEVTLTPMVIVLLGYA